MVDENNEELSNLFSSGSMESISPLDGLDTLVSSWNDISNANMYDDGRLTQNGMFMQMAEIVASRSTCSRNKVGAIVVDTHKLRVLGMGYNGNASRLPNVCDRPEIGNCGCIHAEVNALIKVSDPSSYQVIYTTVSPCLDCAKLILNSQIQCIYFKQEYRDTEGLDLLRNKIGCYKLNYNENI